MLFLTTAYTFVHNLNSYGHCKWKKESTKEYYSYKLFTKTLLLITPPLHHHRLLKYAQPGPVPKDPLNIPNPSWESTSSPSWRNSRPETSHQTLFDRSTPPCRWRVEWEMFGRCHKLLVGDVRRGIVLNLVDPLISDAVRELLLLSPQHLLGQIVWWRRKWRRKDKRDILMTLP